MLMTQRSLSVVCLSLSLSVSSFSSLSRAFCPLSMLCLSSFSPLSLSLSPPSHYLCLSLSLSLSPLSLLSVSSISLSSPPLSLLYPLSLSPSLPLSLPSLSLCLSEGFRVDSRRGFSSELFRASEPLLLLIALNTILLGGRLVIWKFLWLSNRTYPAAPVSDNLQARGKKTTTPPKK